MKSVSYNTHGTPARKGMFRRVLAVAVAAIVFPVSSVVGVSHAEAAMANPCSYSINYYCGVSAASSTFTKDLWVTATANYANDTDGKPPTKKVRYSYGLAWAFYSVETGSGNTVFQTFSKRSTHVSCACGPRAGVSVGCYYKP